MLARQGTKNRTRRFRSTLPEDSRAPNRGERGPGKRLSNGKKQTNPAPGKKSPALLKVAKSPVHGRGVYAARFIPEGARIIEYTGQRVSWEDAPNDETSPHTFNFGLENGDVISPEIGGNEARWINHCCDPNCEAIEEDDRIFIYAMRDIQPGEELFYDYALVIDEPVTAESKKEHQCYCGVKRCRGTMLGLKD
jgi:SET domain-containing protein